MGDGDQLVAPIEGSALALRAETVRPGETLSLCEETSDSLVFVASGSGRCALGTVEQPLGPGSAALAVAGEKARVTPSETLDLVVATVGPEAERHAPLGPRESVVELRRTGAERATGSRAFQMLFGPHNGSTRATLFAGFVPPGRAPWHYHLYDEIVWVPEGPGRLHVGDTTTELVGGSAFRLRPRQVHIVENTSAEAELTIIGIFTPAGSPSAAYLTPEVAAAYGSTEPVA
jgi:quercetin dioxygenase-like cupin family protein